MTLKCLYEKLLSASDLFPEKGETVKLADNEILKRLMPLKDVGDLPPDWLKNVSRGETPKNLAAALKKGKIIIDPFPADPTTAVGSSTIDVHLGQNIEMTRIPLEMTFVNNRPVIRRYTVDFRFPNNNILEHHRAVTTLKGGAWIRFQLYENETLELPPNQLITPFTKEIICVPDDLEANLEGKSSLAREGIATHITSPRFDAGFIGYATLEVINLGFSNFNLYPGMEIAAFSFNQLSSAAKRPYYEKRGKFSGQH